ncbi:hypothetical protein NHQ30_002241 [Ciborinia camelliae]|nr:hypothetical protein NHQ30_002241 [Ciborinia camelliae]
MADSITTTGDLGIKGNMQPPKQPPAQEAAKELTTKSVENLGFDSELTRFAVFHTNGCIWKAADVLLRFENRSDEGDVVDRLQALKILARLRSGALTQSEMPRSTAPKDSPEKSNTKTAKKQSSLEKVTDGSQSQSKTVITTIQKEPAILAQKSVKRKLSPDASQVPNDAATNPDAHNLSRRKTEQKFIDDKSLKLQHMLVNEVVWADEKMVWAERLFQQYKPKLVFSENIRASAIHHFDCLVRTLETASHLAMLRKSLLDIESQGFPDLTIWFKTVHVGPIELKVT